MLCGDAVDGAEGAGPQPGRERHGERGGLAPHARADPGAVEVPAVQERGRVVPGAVEAEAADRVGRRLEVADSRPAHGQLAPPQPPGHLGLPLAVVRLPVGAGVAQDLCRELLSIASSGLQEQAVIGHADDEDQKYLEPLYEILSSGVTWADKANKIS